MIPFVHVPSLDLGLFRIHPFGVLVAVAVAGGTRLAMRRARLQGLDVGELGSFVTWMLVAGFIGGHVIDALFYRPVAMLSDPIRLLYVWEGQGSFGGFLGALLGVLGWRYLEVIPGKEPLAWLPRLQARARPRALLPFSDLVLSVFPVAWMFGRLGCSIAHDHPGVRAAKGALFAVAYGSAGDGAVVRLPLGVELRWGDAARYDLGTLELVFTILLASAFALTWRRRMPPGFYVAATALAYAPVRFALDFLRARDAPHADARYAGLTPAQWACIALLVFGVAFVARPSFRWRATSELPAV